MSAHPSHISIEQHILNWEQVKPSRLPLFQQWRRELACRQAGGHFWHPDEGSMVAWFCCGCGREREGSPQDGC